MIGTYVINALINRLTKRAREAEAALAEANRHIVQIEEIVNSRPFLVSIERKDRTNRFLFMRGRQPFMIESLGMLSDDLDGWREALLGKGVDNAEID